MTTTGLIALALLALAGVAVVIVFVWRADARRNEEVAHDPERVQQEATHEQPGHDRRRG
jgi:hypothetical protein